MSGLMLLKLLHVISVGFFGGGILAMMFAQSFLQRSLEDVERRSVAKLVALVARVLIVPLISVGFVTGLVLMFWMYGGNGMGKVMSSAQPYVHIMLLMGIFALGFAQVWKAKTRKFAAALAENQSFEQARTHLIKGGIFAWLALLATIAAFAVGTLKVPTKSRPVASAAVNVHASSFQA